MERRPRLERWQKAECFRCQEFGSHFCMCGGVLPDMGGPTGSAYARDPEAPTIQKVGILCSSAFSQSSPGHTSLHHPKKMVCTSGSPCASAAFRSSSTCQQRASSGPGRAPPETWIDRSTVPVHHPSIATQGALKKSASGPNRQSCCCQLSNEEEVLLPTKPDVFFSGTESLDSTRASGTSPAFPPPFHRRCFRGGLCFFARHPSSCDHRILKRWWGGCPPLTIHVRTRYHNGLGLPWEASRTPLAPPRLPIGG